MYVSPYISPDSTDINISSTELSSITRTATYAVTPVSAYKVSKAALNVLTVQYSLAFAEKGFTFLAITPGVSIPVLRDSDVPQWIDICV